jgi:hypothetical protein
MKERLQSTYFTEGLSFSDPDTLVQLAAEDGVGRKGSLPQQETSCHPDQFAGV